MFIRFGAIFLFSNLTITVADQVPQLNVGPTCRATAAVIRGRDIDSCQRDEQEAHERLQKEWTEFSQSDKARCVQMTTLGGEPSYVELLTCLEIARDVKNMPEHKENLPNGRTR